MGNKESNQTKQIVPNTVDTYSDALENSLFPPTIPLWNSFSSSTVTAQTCIGV